MSFLSNALASCFRVLILLLLYSNLTPFQNHLSFYLSIFLSFTGVFLGLMAFPNAFCHFMTMMGIIALAGIVVNNGVVLLDYTQLLIDRKTTGRIRISRRYILSKKWPYPKLLKGELLVYVL